MAIALARVVNLEEAASQARILAPQLRRVHIHPVALFVYQWLQQLTSPFGPVDYVWMQNVPQAELTVFRFHHGQRYWDKPITWAELMALPEEYATWHQTLGAWMREAAEHL